MSEEVRLTLKQWKVVKALITENLSSAFDFGPESYMDRFEIDEVEYNDLVQKLDE